jgi:hypothetical protein
MIGFSLPYDTGFFAVLRPEVTGTLQQSWNFERLKKLVISKTAALKADF